MNYIMSDKEKLYVESMIRSLAGEIEVMKTIKSITVDINTALILVDSIAAWLNMIQNNLQMTISGLESSND